MPKFYPFVQNNSGGSYDGFELVIVEANSPEEANATAEQFGVYFGGSYSGRDCSCCGDRWSRVYDYEGTESPERYGEPVDESDPKILIVRL